MKVLFGILLSLISISSFSQRAEKIYYLDFPVYDFAKGSQGDFLEYIQNKFEENYAQGLSEYKVMSLNMRRYLDETNYEKIISKEFIAAKSYRVYLRTNIDLTEFYLFGWGRNVIQPLRNGSSEFIVEPLYTVQLEFLSSCITKEESNRLNTILLNAVKRLLADETIYDTVSEKHIPLLHIPFEQYPEFKSFDIFQQVYDNGIKSKAFPNLASPNLSMEEVFSYKQPNLFYQDSVGVNFPFIYVRELKGLTLQLEFSINVINEQLPLFVSTSNLKVRNPFIGLNFADLDHLILPSKGFNYHNLGEKDKILWIEHDDIKEGLDDPLFTQGIEYILKTRLLKSLNTYD